MKFIIISGIIVIIFVGGIILLDKNSSTNTSGNLPLNNVSIVNGKQIIMINAKGGYQPTDSVAKAGIPTVIRFNTDGTFDCSSSVRIPSMNISQILPQTGTTDIDIGSQPATILHGVCGMGMYPFEIEFKS